MSTNLALSYIFFSETSEANQINGFGLSPDKITRKSLVILKELIELILIGDNGKEEVKEFLESHEEYFERLERTRPFSESVPN